ncbi:hypothetical protein PsorP6_011098 [Peronosclerospora sorghi]|uniref:Uncharacterized protein n=1 Tax=Peronosclerospora sorghi TaxID=230839 RepID=A0ACC0VW75_9STRA|nr:hypothetical protein PsorP6_011098 [Peronosclerospora sorghi]
MTKKLSMTPGAIRARERRAALRKRAVVKDNSDGNAKGEVSSYTDDDKGAELDTDDHKGAKRDSGESKFNNNSTKCEAACSDVLIVRKGGERGTVDGNATEHNIDGDQGAECETNGNKGAVIPAVTKTLNAIPAVTKALNAILAVTKALNAILAVTKTLNAIPAVTKALNAIPTVTKALNAMPASRFPGRKKNIARGKKSTIPADGACPPSQIAACFPIQIDLSFQAANIQDLGAPELVNALSSSAGDPFSNEWLGNKTTQIIMDIDVHPESESKTFSVVWLPDEPDVPSVLEFFMIPRNVALKVYEEAKVQLEKAMINTLELKLRWTRRFDSQHVYLEAMSTTLIVCIDTSNTRGRSCNV